LNDGSGGLAAVKAHGGLSIIQDPEEALFGDMPRHALHAAGADHILPVNEIGSVLQQVAGEDMPERGADPMATQVERAPELIHRDFAEQAANRRSGELSIYICPECGGALWQFEAEKHTQFNCHVGHAYSAANLLMEKSSEVEAALWLATRLLKEKCTLTRQIAERVREAGDGARAALIEGYAGLDEEYIQVIREKLIDPTPSPTSQAIQVTETLEAVKPSEVLRNV
jgi:two-component system, chemotaxis family, protein-glutamate methylesterase/glutaminase